MNSNLRKTTDDWHFIFAHGAGADKQHEWMLQMDTLLSRAGISVSRFNFPYMDKRAQDGKRRPPDRMPKLLAAFAEQVAIAPAGKKLLIGGKSMGGRVASLLYAQDQFVPDGRLVPDRHPDALVCMGFPFHPPGKPENYRGDHLAHLKTPTLILQGERDTFATREEVDGYKLGENVTVEYLADGDHSFKPRVKSGTTLAANQEVAASRLVEWLNSL